MAKLNELNLILDDWESPDIYFIYSTITPYTRENIVEFIDQMSLITIYSIDELLKWLPYLSKIGVNDLGSLIVLTKLGLIQLPQINAEAIFFQKLLKNESSSH